MENMDIYNMCREVPENAKKTIKGGRMNGKTDINPVWRIITLTKLFGPCGLGWYYNVTRQWTETYAEEVAAFVNIELYIKVDGEWSKPIHGTGGNMLAKKEVNGIYVSDECFKMATTDAISVACKQLGIGADVYWNDDSSKYNSHTPAEEKKTDDPQITSSADETKPDERLRPVYEELLRTGFGKKNICCTYKIDSVEEMTDLQIRDFLNKIRKLPDKESV